MEPDNGVDEGQRSISVRPNDSEGSPKCRGLVGENLYVRSVIPALRD